MIIICGVQPFKFGGAIKHILKPNKSNESNNIQQLLKEQRPFPEHEALPVSCSSQSSEIINAAWRGHIRTP